MEIISTSILAAGTIGTLIAASFVDRTLKSNHDWQRREYAQNIIRDWNANTSKHWQALEDVFPHLRDVDVTSGKVTELTKQQAKEIYTCEKTDEINWNLRYHIVELLNYLEFVSMSYTQQVADNYIIETCVRDTMTKYYDLLKNVIEVIEVCEGYQPWKPYVDLVSKWKSVRTSERNPTA